MTGLPRMLNEFAPLPGVLKAEYDDFEVEEIPLYSFAGQGTHAYFLIEKRGLSTMQAASDIAAALGVRRFDIGYAGLKDARAVTRQWFSVEHIEPARIRALEIPRIHILEITKHSNKLRIGHLKGNRFKIRVRDTDVSRLGPAQDALEALQKKGVPNYYGVQRFGSRGDTWAVGRAALQSDFSEALDLLLGRPGAQDHGPVRAARTHYEAGNFSAAAREWPRMFREQRQALKTLEQSRGNKKRAFLSIDSRLREFYFSAYQSHLFNQITAMRLPRGLGNLMHGDLAFIHGAGAVFRVEDPAREQPRADRLEISPTGPLFGYRMTEPDGEVAALEHGLIAREAIDTELFKSERIRLKGSRRALRFPLGGAAIELDADSRGPYLGVQFSLPRGCYATCVLRELFQEQALGDGAGEADDD